jgi:hypothetical protein
MFARKVSLQLKPHSIVAVTRTIEQDIMPLLHTQQGFQDEIAFVVPGVTEAVRVSLWDQKEQADAYHCSTYLAVLRTLANVVEGAPQVHPYAASNSTFHKLVAHAAI